MARSDPSDVGGLIATTPAVAAVMKGRPMAGWLRIDGEELDDDAALQSWAVRAVAVAATLPPKS